MISTNEVQSKAGTLVIVAISTNKNVQEARSMQCQFPLTDNYMNVKQITK